MNGRVKDALIELFGDEEQANREAERIDQTNRSIEEQNLIARDAATEDDATEVVVTEPAVTGADATEDVDSEEDNEATEPEPLVLDDDAVRAISENLAGHLQQAGILYSREEVIEAARSAMAETMAGVNDGVTALADTIKVFTDRIAALEATDEEKRAQWQADLPRQRGQPVTYRPRVEHAEDTSAPPSLADRAAETLNNLKELAPRK